MYSLRDVERRPVLCSFKRIEGGLSKKKSLKKNPSLYIYSLRDVERRPVLCFFKRIEGGSAYQKQKIS